MVQMEIELKDGVFDNMTDAIAAAEEAQKKLFFDYTLEDRDRIIDNIRKRYLEVVDEISQLEYDETKFGRYEDKLDKNTGGIISNPGTEALKTNLYTGDKGLTVEYYAPYGVIGAITPSTNPSLTVLGNGISAIASGNSMVFNGHPNAKLCTALSVQVLNQGAVEAGAPENLLTCVLNPDKDSLDEILTSPIIKLLVGTGGPGMVDTLMRSGKKTIAAGAGNPPVIIDETADLALAADKITGNAGFDNNLLCIGEKQLFINEDVFDDFVEEFKNVGNVLLNEAEAEAVLATALTELEDGTYAPNKEFVGQNANFILKEAGIEVEGDPRLAFFKTDKDHPFVQTEQMMPVIPLVPYESFEEAVEWAVDSEQGNKHSASIWSKDIYRVTHFGRLVDTSIYVQNGNTSAAFGEDGSGTDSPTIATPTGEGITDPFTFTRRRRFTMADGGNYLL